jgi:hypothetical protein
MKSNEHDPLATNRASLAGMPLPVTPSLAPHELAPEEEPEDDFGPGSPGRRARLQRYVKVTVAACALLCVAAIVRVGIAQVNAADGEREESAAHPSPVVTPPPAPTDTTSAAAVAASAPSAEPASPSGAPSAAGTASAIEERELARRSLEHGKARDAVAAAERAVAADPTDADSWLLLGSANQELGHAAAARTAFRSCLKSAKHGPVRECRAMLR